VKKNEGWLIGFIKQEGTKEELDLNRISQRLELQFNLHLAELLGCLMLQRNE
jgi:hypothetical protein